jgi:hypothetical protein
MISKLVSLLCCVSIVTALALPVRGQQPANPAGQQPNPGATTAQQAAGAGQKPQTTERRAPAVEYTIALAATLTILVIVCMPSRKR